MSEPSTRLPDDDTDSTLQRIVDNRQPGEIESGMHSGSDDDISATERFEGDLSFKEVAEACGIDEAAARKRVSRALAKLRAELGEE